MAGHGWHMTSRSIVDEVSCECEYGVGKTVYYEEEWESDWAGDKTKNSSEVICQNYSKCPKRKRLGL